MAHDVYKLRFETEDYGDFRAVRKFINSYEFYDHFFKKIRTSSTGTWLKTNNPCEDVDCMKAYLVCLKDRKNNEEVK
jgi:hypothetical protein